MNKHNTFKHSHLTLSDRIAIEQGLKRGASIRSIADEIEKDPTTIAKEIKRATDSDSFERCIRDCSHFDQCRRKSICHEDCNSFCKFCVKYDCTTRCRRHQPFKCERLLRSPHVCNGCRNLISCRYQKRLYKAEKAHKEYSRRLSESRKGINATIDEIHALNDILTPLVRNGQPLSHIYANHGSELGISRSTLYNYIDLGILNVRNIDLPRRVKYKKRRKKKVVRTKDYSCRKGRTYRDFLKYLDRYPETEVIEMDTVKGTHEAGKCLLTMMFRSSRLMLIFLLNRCTENEVIRVLDSMSDRLGEKLFQETFPIILTDNGPEFKNADRMECDRDGVVRTRIFYCDPNETNQKSRLERNHEYIRMIVPKGRSMYRLTEEDVLLMCNHINSVSRESMNGHTPYEAAVIFHNKKVMDAFELTAISPDNVVLHPSLLIK